MNVQKILQMCRRSLIVVYDYAIKRNVRSMKFLNCQMKNYQRKSNDTNKMHSENTESSKFLTLKINEIPELSNERLSRKIKYT